MRSIRTLNALLVCVVTLLSPPANAIVCRDLFSPDGAAKRMYLEEKTVLDVLDRLILSKDQTAEELNGWIARLQRRPLSILEHTALSLIHRSTYLDAMPDGKQIGAEVETLLRASWLHLTGTVPDLSSRLPEYLMLGQSRQAQVFEAAAFVGESRQRITTWREYLKMPQNAKLILMPMAALVASAFSTSGSAVIAGLYTSYLIVSIVESYGHDVIGHRMLSKSLAKINYDAVQMSLRPLKSIIAYMDLAFLSHMLGHHGMFSPKTGHVLTTAHADLIPAIEQSLEAKGYSTPRFRKEKEGRSLDLRARIAYTVALAPFQFAVALVVGFDPAFLTSMFAGGLIFQFNSGDFHPLLHRRRSVAVKHPSPTLRWYINTEMAEEESRRHWVHHNVGGSFNITPLNLGDFLLGRLRDPNIEDMLRMRREDTIGAVWDEPN